MMSEVLEKRFGFRVAEYGLRQVFPRVPDHPLLAGLATETLRDWRGEATLLPERLKYELNPKFNGAPTVTEEHYEMSWGEGGSLKIDNGRLTVGGRSCGVVDDRPSLS